MDSAYEEPSIRPNTTDSLFSNKNFIITVLIFLLALSFLGVNLLAILGNWLQAIINIFGPLFSQILSVFGYTAGTVLDKSTDLVTDVAKTGIDIAGGTVHSVGGLLKNASKDNIDAKAKTQLDQSIGDAKQEKNEKDLDKKINNGGDNLPPAEPTPTESANPIQNPITSQKTSWCLVGEYQDKRGCIEIGEADQCLSGQVFPSQKLCLNPTMGQAPPHPLKSQATH
jgi:hypothetical protein